MKLFGLQHYIFKVIESKQIYPSKRCYVFILIDAVFADSFLSPIKKVDIVSNCQPEGIKRKQRELEIESIEALRKRLEENYQVQVNVLDDREHELQEKNKALDLKKKEKVAA